MSYPLIGAVVGSCVGGPLGCLAGAKVGVFATVTCFVLGNILVIYHRSCKIVV
jgi:syntaxin 17